jgi:iron complex transport system substrate-binding protein
MAPSIVAPAFALCILLTPACRKPDPAAAAGGTRVVSLAPSMTEIICAVGGGDLLVGRTSACDYPPDVVAKTPVIGGFGTPSLELLIAARPTLVLDVDLADEALGAQLKSAGLRREHIRCRGLADIPEALLQAGALLHREEAARRLADSLRAQIEALRRASEGGTNRPSVYVEIWNDPLTTVGRGTFISDLVALAGGRNIGDEVAREYFTVSDEWVLAQNPDVILCFYTGNDAGVREQVLKRFGWQHLDAVRRGAVYAGFDNNVVLRPGPRVLDGVKAIRDALAAGARQ